MSASSDDAHVAITGDHMHYVGIVAAASSVFSTSMNPERIRLHIIAEDGPELSQLRAALTCSLGESAADQDEQLSIGEEEIQETYEAAVATVPNATGVAGNASSASVLTTMPPPKQMLRWWEIVVFNASQHMAPNLTIVAPNNEQKGNLAADLNYARFYMSALLPGVEKVIYLDADTIVAKDICKLYDTALIDEDDRDSPVIAAVARDFKSVCFSLIYCDEPRVRDFLALNGIVDPERELNFFNAGVIVFHLGRWAERGLTEKTEFWIRSNSELSIYSLGSNPPLILSVGSKFESLDPKWNCDGFGFKRPTSVTHECQVDAGIRHWSGHRKPWRRDGKYKMFWYPYVTDLNCLLTLSHSPLKYAPPPELPPRLRAVSPEHGAQELPIADRLPLEYVQPNGERYPSSLLPPVAGGGAAPASGTPGAAANNQAPASSSGTNAGASTTNQADVASQSGRNDNKKELSTWATETKDSEKSTGSGKDGKEEAAVLAGDTERHRSREYAGVIEVQNELQRTLSQYKTYKNNAKWSRQFVERLRSHHSIKWAPRLRDAKVNNRRMPCSSVDHVLVIVHNNSLYVDSRQYGPRSPCGSRPPDRAMETFKFLHSTRDVGKLPNTIFILCLDPRGTSYDDMPIFSFGKARGYEQAGILVPNPHFGRNHVHRWDRISRQFEEAAQRHPWEERTPRVLWRGQLATSSPVIDYSSGASGNTPSNEAGDEVAHHLCTDPANKASLEAVSLTKGAPDVFDMRLADGLRDAPLVFRQNVRSCRPSESLPADIRSVIDKASSLKHKSALAPLSLKTKLPGTAVTKQPKFVNTADAAVDALPQVFEDVEEATKNLFMAKWSGRMSTMTYKFVASLPAPGGAPPPARNEIWLLGSVVLMWRSRAVEWYYPALANGITHVTIDRTNAEDVVRELIADDNRAQRLALEASAVHDNHLCSSCIMECWHDIITRYNARFGLHLLDIPSVIRDLDAHRIRF